MSWNSASLELLAKAHPDWTVDNDGGCLCITNDEGIDAFAYIGEQQMLIEVVLFGCDVVTDSAKLNALILRSHHLLPLSAIGIKHIGDQDYYIAFGALSTKSLDEVVIEEIETLYSNVSEFVELYSEFTQ
ncbi:MULTISPECIES: DUF2170 family protein [unclassified Agarivorans]|uniref:DUF2170 family protein n=1 Tax=unclassified Agarivorans TaxID=2636026 RepID=UPI0010F3D04C|nr:MULTISPECIES: DUF2170 family protein [unclassified Agarivorans]MDO6684577.1 DUF2170 family protein [Agarivorans sp. 3_MG-2023]MDO6714742.1 DUF2170 family protein [Agarivorans sp. 2_MG-2023]MDO6762865.1 DUF2170 family protein [Agarivorans sp. 1_MG-2023]GDY24687.1 hypothetical protein AHAT_05770 [Agarivorans sp. Toyoura001]